MLWIIIALLCILLGCSVIMHVFSYSGYQNAMEENADHILDVQRDTFKSAYAAGIEEGIQRERHRVLREEYKKILRN